MQKKIAKSKNGSILVAIDLTKHSNEALEFANDLAIKLHKDLIILHAVHDPEESPGFYAPKGKKKNLAPMEKVAKEMLEKYLSKVQQQSPELELSRGVQTIVVYGMPESKILEVAEQKKVDMIVVGSHGRKGISKLLLGSRADHIVTHSLVPVVVVKTKKAKKLIIKKGEKDG
ncbi:MAG: universal stress protein [SAR324 cluster bacterium]|nr:universal stress protein [SAR324 cluster bacterium]